MIPPHTHALTYRSLIKYWEHQTYRHQICTTFSLLSNMYLGGRKKVLIDSGFCLIFPNDRYIRWMLFFIPWINVLFVISNLFYCMQIANALVFRRFYLAINMNILYASDLIHKNWRNSDDIRAYKVFEENLITSVQLNTNLEQHTSSAMFWNRTISWIHLKLVYFIIK